MNDAIRAAALRLAQIAQDVGLPATFTAINNGQLILLEQQLDLPPALVEWYTVAAPQDVAIPTLGNWQYLEAPEKLRAALAGYQYNAISGEPLEGWDPTWLVIGGEPEIPLIARTRGAHDPTIYHCQLNADEEWELTPLSTDVAGFLEGLADYLHLYVGQYHQHVHDEQYVLNPTFREAFTNTLTQRESTAPYISTWMRDWLGLDTGVDAKKGTT